MNAITGLIAAIGFAAGFLVAWLWSRASSQSQRLELEKQAASQQGAAEELKKQSAALQEQVRLLQARVEEEQKLRAAADKEVESQRANIAEQRRLLDEAEKKLKEAFQSLASEALQASSRQFMELAGARFDSLQKEASGDLEQRKVAIGGMVEPLRKGRERTSRRGEQDRIGPAGSLRQPAHGSAATRHHQQGTAGGNREPGEFAQAAAGEREVGRADAAARRGTGGDVSALRFCRSRSPWTRKKAACART